MKHNQSHKGKRVYYKRVSLFTTVTAGGGGEGAFNPSTNGIKSPPTAVDVFSHARGGGISIR